MDISTEHAPIPAAVPCKNCGADLLPPAKFCSTCGQRNFDGRVRLRDLVGKFFAGLWHLDNKFLKTCRDVMVPARVAIRYFQGKIDRYHHPIQFFFMVMFFFLLLFNRLFDGVGFNNTQGKFSVSIKSGDTTAVQPIEQTLQARGIFPLLEDFVRIQTYREAYERLPDSMRSNTAQMALDSIIRELEGPKEAVVQQIFEYQSAVNKGPVRSDTLDLTFFTTTVHIDVFDLIRYSPEEIITRYQLTAWDDQVAVRQGIKSIKDPKGLIRQYVGSFGWSIFILVAFMALVLRGMYWKTKRLYVEHFVFVINQQSGAYLLLTLCLLLQYYCFKISWLWFLGLIWVLISLPIAMKRFYGYSWPWTIGFTVLYSLLYLIALVFLFIATLLVVFVLF